MLSFRACNFELKGGLDHVAAPLREFHGSDDDWTSAATCKAYIDQLKAAGADAEMSIFEGARHAFDTSLAKALVKVDDAQSSFGCMRVEDDNGDLVNADTGKLFTYADACVTMGPTVQYNEAATKGGGGSGRSRFSPTSQVRPEVVVELSKAASAPAPGRRLRGCRPGRRG